MSFEVTLSRNGRPQLNFVGEPSYCHALEAAPAGSESKLGHDRWLVMVFAAWSIPDIRAIQTALDAVKYFDGAIQLGVRPFDDPAEHRSWYPDIAELGATPAWLLFEDGALRFQHLGLMTGTSLVEVIKTSFLLADREVAQ